MTTEQSAFQHWLVGWNRVCEANQTHVGEGWTLASEGIGLLAVGVELVLESNWGTQTRRMALAATATHLVRLASSYFALSVRGHFDAALYLLRGLRDGSSLFIASLRLGEDFADSILKSDTPSLPAKARIALLRAVQPSNQAEVSALLERESTLQNALRNETSHLNGMHLNLALGPERSGPSTLQFKGYESAIAVRHAWAIGLRDLNSALSSLAMTTDAVGDPAWLAEQDDFNKRYRLYSEALLQEFESEYQP